MAGTQGAGAGGGDEGKGQAADGQGHGKDWALTMMPDPTGACCRAGRPESHRQSHLFTKRQFQEQTRLTQFHSSISSVIPKSIFFHFYFYFNKCVFLKQTHRHRKLTYGNQRGESPGEGQIRNRGWTDTNDYMQNR